jgi:(E)-benzylidenesuccinyl-CoA hydratase
MAVDLALKDGVAIVTINRPEAMNAIDPETHVRIHEVFGELGGDATVEAVILTGAGGRAFCAGSDLKKTLAVSGSYATQEFGGRELAPCSRALAIEKPVICAINGVAVGGGLELALACDIRIAAETARFGLPEVKIGSIPGDGGTQRLPRVVGMSNALYLLMTGAIIDAQEALRIGLVTRVVPAADLAEEAMKIARQIAGNAPLSVRAVKRLAHAGIDMALADGLKLEDAYFGLLRDTEDRREGRVAFAEKRPPKFTGR